MRNAIYTFSLVAEGVRQLLEQKTAGPLLILGHSTGGEIQFLLNESSLKNRLNGRSIGWGTGGPAFLTKELDEKFGVRAERVQSYARYPRVDRLRARDPQGYISSNYIGLLNPLKGRTPLDVAKAWFQAEERRRPQFKQTLQDMEHQGFTEHRARLEKEIREILQGNKYGIKADDVIRDLFSTMSPPMKGYRRMAWVVGSLDAVHQVDGKLPGRIAVVGQGPAGIVALAAAAVDSRITHVVATDSLASYVSDAPYKNQRLGLMAAGILREVGDVAHLAALCLPRRVIIAGGVSGDGTQLTAEGLRQAFEPTAQVGKLLDADGALQLLGSGDTERIIKALR